MPGGAANVARNLTALSTSCELFGVVGRDDTARTLKQLLVEQQVVCEGVIGDAGRPTSVKSRIVAQHQQMVRVDKESTAPLDGRVLKRLLSSVEERLDQADAVVIGDYGKGVVTEALLKELDGQ